jgi:hypothetical protein
MANFERWINKPAVGVAPSPPVGKLNPAPAAGGAAAAPGVAVGGAPV